MYGLTLSILSLRHTISLSERRKAVLLSSRTIPGKRRIASSASPASRVPAAKNLASASRSARLISARLPARSNFAGYPMRVFEARYRHRYRLATYWSLEFGDLKLLSGKLAPGVQAAAIRPLLAKFVAKQQSVFDALRVGFEVAHVSARR